MMTRNTKATLTLLGFTGAIAAFVMLMKLGTRLLGPGPTLGSIIFIAVIAAWFHLRGMFNDD